MLPPQKAFGTVLRRMRTAKGLSQERLALEGNIDRTFISMLERGIRQPSLTSLILIAEVLGISASELMAAVERQMYLNIQEGGHENN